MFTSLHGGEPETDVLYGNDDDDDKDDVATGAAEERSELVAPFN